MSLADLVLAPQLFPDISRYALIANAPGEVAVAVDTLFDKRDKQVHRYSVADVNGEVRLTVPIEKPEHSHGTPWSKIGISRHGQWWNVHRTALESAYGRTPFFEFYIDRLLPFFASDTPDRFGSVAALAVAAEQEVCRILHIQPVVALSGRQPSADSRSCPCVAKPYWQVRGDKLGFIPGLSILDLIFNLGPEALLYLKGL